MLLKYSCFVETHRHVANSYFTLPLCNKDSGCDLHTNIIVVT